MVFGVGAVPDDGALAASRMDPLPTGTAYPPIRSRGRRTVYTRAHAVYADAEVPRLDSPRGRVGVGGVERAEEFFQRDP